MDLQWDKTGLHAYLIMGKTVRPLKVTKENQAFTISESLPKPSELKLEVSSQGSTETISIPLR